MIRAALFGVVSIFLAYISRKPLARPRSHGFHRFFAWESIVALFLLNLPHWIDHPFSPGQLVSWTFITISAVLALYGAHLLRSMGQPDPARANAELFAFERTSRLVTEGIYTYIRHPLYSSLLFLTWGVFLKHASWSALLLSLFSSLFLFLTAKSDEAECLEYFGLSYRDYMQRTRRFLPFLL
jgi:protein-S-isoprenylcysteine O-methyltransferase Ste14